MNTGKVLFWSLLIAISALSRKSLGCSHTWKGMSGCRSKVSSLAHYSQLSGVWTRQQLYSDAEQNIRDKAARKTSSRLDFSRTLRLELDLWFEHRATQQPEQIALTCAARQKIIFKNGQYGFVRSCAAAFTWPSSSERSLALSSVFRLARLHVHLLYSSNWNLYSPSPAEDGATVRCYTLK